MLQLHDQLISHVRINVSFEKHQIIAGSLSSDAKRYTPLSCDAKRNTPRRFGIGLVDPPSGVLPSQASRISGRGKGPNSCAEGSRPFDRRRRQGTRADVSTVSRELRRNALPSGRYSPLHAAGAYQLRRRREAVLERICRLRDFVGDRLSEGWTPEQIAGGSRPAMSAACAPWGSKPSTPSSTARCKGEELWRYLTRRHKRRRPRGARPSRDTIKDRAFIHDRPKTSKAASTLAIGRAISSPVSARDPCCLPWPRGSPERPPRKPSRSCSPCSGGSIPPCENPSLSITTQPSQSTPCREPCAT